jgi:predicted phosphodiesterase
MADPARLSILGGVYANQRALVATLAEMRSRGADEIWCLGDLGGFGPHPEYAIEILRSAAVPTIRGNYDDAVGHGRQDCGCGYSDPRDNHFAQIAYDYTVARTAPEHRQWMRELPERHRMEMGGRRVLLCHGSPRKVNEFLWDSTCSDAFLEWLCDTWAADVLVCAHTGLHWHRALPSGRHVINAGAIGRPANDGRACVWYAEIALEPQVRVEFRPVAYDHESQARAMEAEGLPAEFVETICTGWWTTCLENMPSRERRRGRF